MVLFLISVANMQAQETITLEQLQILVKENYPLLKQKQLYTNIGENKAKELTTNFLPEVNLVGQLTNQSEVITLALPGLGVFSQKAVQGNVGMELRENIFDYGSVKTQKKIERGDAEMHSTEVDIDFQKLRERINSLYANINLQQENKKIMFLRLNELAAKRQKIQSAVKNGAALQSEFLILESEELSTQQKVDEINANLMSWYKTLSIFTNKTMDTTVIMGNPNADVSLQSANIRPEYRLYDIQSNTLKLKESMITRKSLPKVFVFARGYYGRYGYNFLNGDIHPFGIFGAGFQWSLSSYYTLGKEKGTLKINKDLTDNQKQIFDLNIQATVAQQEAEIKRLQKSIDSDQKIVEAKTAIRKASSSKLDNGIITSSDFITDLNAENQAQFNLKLHQIQLMMAKYNYNTTLGY